MNLSPLYELKDRLTHIAIAGTSLMEEDFRLARAVEGMGTLAGANPVFARIKAEAEELLTAPAGQRGGKLLDVLSLVDAVVYTQGTSGGQGELQPMNAAEGSYVHASYGELQPLITALTGTGSGRMAVIQSAWNHHPAYFSDFRVLPSVVRALGDGSAELASLAETILSAQGEGVIPLLRKDFAPDGKKEMVRRVRLTVRLAGGKENEWYKAALPGSQKAVREVLIAALGSCQDNTGLLLDLCRGERGKAKRAALRSLACMDSPEARAFWEAEIQKRPSSAWELESLSSVLAGDITADSLRALTRNILSADGFIGDLYDDLRSGVYAAYGQYSPALRDFWLEMVSEMPALNKPPYEKPAYPVLTPAELLEKCMLLTVLWRPCAETFALARELHETAGKVLPEQPYWFAGAAFAADWLERPAQEVYDTYAVRFDPRRNAEQSEWRLRLLPVLERIDHDDNGFRLSAFVREPLTGEDDWKRLPIPNPDPRWSCVLTQKELEKEYRASSTSPYWEKLERLDWDAMMGKLIDKDSPEVCAAIGDYLFRQIWVLGSPYRYRDWLKECGWTRWDGLLPHCVQVQGDVEWYSLRSLLETFPISRTEKAKELREIDQLVKKKKIKVRYGRWHEEEVETLLAQWENEA